MANPTYPHKVLPPNTAPNVEFGGQAFDGNRVPLGGTESGFVTKDATGTPVTSPVTAATGANSVLVVPTNASSIIITAATAPVLVSEDVAFGSSLAIPVGVAVQLDVARQSTIYLRGSGGSSTVSFAFQLVD